MISWQPAIAETHYLLEAPSRGIDRHGIGSADDCGKVVHLSGAVPAVQVTVWFPAQFAELRRICLSACGGEAAFCASLSRCHRCVPPTLRAGLRS